MVFKPVGHKLSVQSQKMARSLKFFIIILPVAKTKALISFAVTAKLICIFVFANADCWVFRDTAQILPEMIVCYLFVM